jgi:hypothetical protein
MPEFLDRNQCDIYDPLGDGNCLFRALLVGTSEDDTLENCFKLRSEIKEFMMENPDLKPYVDVPHTVAEWANANLDVIDSTKDPLLQYCEMMRDATPYQCEYANLLEALIFSVIKRVTIVIYEIQDINSQTYIMRMQKIIDKTSPVCCLLHTVNHYQTLLPCQKYKQNEVVEDKQQQSSNVIEIHDNVSDDIDNITQQHISSTRPQKSVESNCQLFVNAYEENTNTSKNSIHAEAEHHRNLNESGSQKMSFNCNSNEDITSFLNPVEIEMINKHLLGMCEDDLKELYDTIRNAMGVLLITTLFLLLFLAVTRIHFFLDHRNKLE